MSWILSKINLKPRKNNSRNEEVSDIIDRMPTSFSKWITLTIIGFTIIFFCFGWAIKYPDVITGKIKISSNVASVKLPACISGKLEILGFKPQDEVTEGEYIAIIENSANTPDVIKVNNLLKEFNPNQRDSLAYAASLFPQKVSLGELNLKYYSFISSLQSITDYYKNNIYEQQRIGLLEDIKWKEKILIETQNALRTSTENYELAKKWYDKYSSINKDIVPTYEFEVDKSKIDLLAAKQQMQNLIKESASIEMQISDSRNQLSKLLVERDDKEKQLQLNLLSSYHDLTDQIKQWEQTYVLKAPFDGKVEFLKFWVNGQYVNTKEDIFSIIPKESALLGQVLLPSIGAGKVKIGSKVNIKLDDYPYSEFGSVDGVIKAISLISNEDKTALNTSNMYLVSVELPNGLVTNYGDSLNFKHELGGVADIIVKDRKFIERLFDNIKFRVK